MTERPNLKALIEALDIYRDAMRPFIVRRLKQVPGRKVEECVRSALRDDPYNRFERNVNTGRSVEEAIDINDFPRIVSAYWHDAFRNVFKSGSGARGTLKAIVNARNKTSHPDSGDIDWEYAAGRMEDIAGLLAEINEPGPSRAVTKIKESVMPFRTPAHKFRQGDRDVYAFTLDLETLDKLLPERVDDKVVKDANRPLTASHAKNIQGYLEEKEKWLLGTLLLGISPDAIEFESFPADSGAESGVGQLTIHSEGAETMKMFDGQHRRRAIKNALAELSHSPRHAQRLAALKQASLPVMLYAEDRIEALQQMFADAAKTRSIERNTVTRFDRRDAFNRAALRIAKESDLFRGRVEMQRASVARSSPNIISINQLAVTLKTMEVGFKGRVSKERNDEYMLDDLNVLCERSLTWADDFMPAARNEYNDLMASEIDNSEILAARSKTMAYNATVIRILAGCFHDWTQDDKDWRPLADFLRDASMKPGVKRGSLLVDAGVVAPGGTSPIAQRSAVLHAIEHIVKQARENRSSSRKRNTPGGLR